MYVNQENNTRDTGKALDEKCPEEKGDSIKVTKYLNFWNNLRKWEKRKKTRNFRKKKSYLGKPHSRNEAAVPIRTRGH